MKKLMIALMIGMFLIPTFSYAQTTKDEQTVTYLKTIIALLQQQLQILIAQQTAQLQLANVPQKVVVVPASNPIPVQSPLTIKMQNTNAQYHTDIRVGDTLWFTPFIQGDYTYPVQTFTTTNPNGFNRINGHTVNESPNTQAQTLGWSVNGSSGTITMDVTTPGTYTFTDSIPAKNLETTVSFTVVP